MLKTESGQLSRVYNNFKKHLEIFDNLKDYEIRYKFIHLASAIEELAKFIYLLYLKECGEQNFSKFLKMEPFPNPLRTYLKSVLSDLENMYRHHKFKYYLFLSFYEIIGSTVNKEADYEELLEDAKRIEDLRNLCLSSPEEIEEDENFINELRKKVNDLVSNLDNIRPDICSIITLDTVEAIRKHYKSE